MSARDGVARRHGSRLTGITTAVVEGKSRRHFSRYRVSYAGGSPSLVQQIDQVAADGAVRRLLTASVDQEATRFAAPRVLGGFEKPITATGTLNVTCEQRLWCPNQRGGHVVRGARRLRQADRGWDSAAIVKKRRRSLSFLLSIKRLHAHGQRAEEARRSTCRTARFASRATH